MREYLRAFLRVIWSDWTALVSAAFSVPFAVAAIFTPRGHGATSWGIFAALAGLLAALRAWQLEHKRRIALHARIVSQEIQQEILDELSKFLGRSKSLLTRPVTSQNEVEPYVDDVNEWSRSVLAFMAKHYSVSEANTWFSISTPPPYPVTTMFPAAHQATALLAARHDRLGDFIRFKQKDVNLALEKRETA